MHATTRFVVMATVPIEVRYAYMDDDSFLLGPLGGYIGLDARSKEEFVAAGLLYWESFPAKADCYLQQLQMDLKRYAQRPSVLTMKEHCANVNRAEYIRQLSVIWDRDYA